jgi:outer membrane murein-binding lipoprotein Lpp
MKTKNLTLIIAASVLIIIVAGCIHVTVVKTTPAQAQNLSTNAPALNQIESK